MAIYGTDAKGWYWHERMQIRIGWWLFVAMEWVWFRPLCFLSRGRVWAHESNVWLTLASWGYLVSDLWRNDMPEHHRIGGVWR